MSKTEIDIRFEDHQRAALARGFDEVAVREWPPGQTVDEHTHPFSVEALVVQGEMWLTIGEETHHLRPGDSFELALAEPHAERYGVEGATYWAARRNPPAVVAA